MIRSAYTLLIYGFIVSLGGVIGFMQAHSIPSLVMGLVFGALCSFFALFCFKSHVLGLISGAIITGVNTLFFLYRFFLTWNFLPAGLMMIISLIVFLRMLRTLLKQFKAKEG